MDNKDRYANHQKLPLRLTTRNYHLVFPVKYRTALLEPAIVTALKALVSEITERYELTIEQLGTDGDHISW